MQTRLVLGIVALPFLVLAASCSSAGSNAGSGAEATSTLGIPAIKPGVPDSYQRAVQRPASEAEAAQNRAAPTCKYRRGAMPAETLGPEIPIGDGTVNDTNIPVKHIIVMMQENRSFDSYYAHLAAWAAKNVKNADGTPVALDIDGVKDVNDDGSPLSIPKNIDDASQGNANWVHAEHLCHSDTNHEWYGAHTEWNGGLNNGFFQANQGFTEEGEPKVGLDLLNGQRAFSYYDERDIPFYYHLASRFAIGDRYFSSLIGPTWPNRDFMYAASSYGATTNINPLCTKPGTLNSLTCRQEKFFNRDTVIFDELTRRNIDWKFYVDTTTGQEARPGSIAEDIQRGKEVLRLGAFLTPPQLGLRYGTSTVSDHIGSYLDLVQIIASGNGLPAVTFIDAAVAETSDGEDEHPPGDIQTGQNLVATVVQTLMGSPYWKDTAMFITYDENGGIYDHVPPPPACSPETELGDPQPNFITDEDIAFARDHADINTGFDRYGFRVPVIVVSPFAKRSYVSHKTYDHTSILRFIEAKFNLPALTKRDANADAMFDMFDFSNVPWAQPPTDMPLHLANVESWIDPDGFAQCQSLYDKNGPQY
jgi:phospholipase C